MSDQWHVIVPAEASNLIENPSFEVNITDGWTTQDIGAGAVFARSTTSTYYGIGAARITAGNDIAQILSDSFNLDDDATVYAQCMMRTPTGTNGQLVIRDVTTPANRATSTGSVGGEYEKLATSWKNETGGAVDVRIYLKNLAGDGTTIVRFDGVAAFIDVNSTYLDGDQPGCEWNGQAHNSTSTRSALSFDGGIDYEFAADLSFFVDEEVGWSAPPVSNTFQPNAMTKGAFFNGSQTQGRPGTLNGIVVGTSKTDLHDKMKAMGDTFDVAGGQEVRLEYDGGTSLKYIKARYEAGIQGNYRAGNAVTQRIPLRFFCADPDFYQISDTNDVLDVNDTATLRYIARRRRSTGQWDDMGLTANPNAGGEINAICIASNGLVYIGGLFDGWDGDGDIDNGVIYNPVTDTFSIWGAANDISDRITSIVEGPDGTIYAGGYFVDLGDGNGDGVVSWNGAAWVVMAFFTWSVGLKI